MTVLVYMSTLYYRLTVSSLYASLPLDRFTWLTLAGLTRAHVAVVVTVNPGDLKVYSDAGDLNGFVEEVIYYIIVITQ